MDASDCVIFSSYASRSGKVVKYVFLILMSFEPYTYLLLRLFSCSNLLGRKILGDEELEYKFMQLFHFWCMFTILFFCSTIMIILPECELTKTSHVTQSKQIAQNNFERHIWPKPHPSAPLITGMASSVYRERFEMEICFKFLFNHRIIGGVSGKVCVAISRNNWTTYYKV